MCGTVPPDGWIVVHAWRSEVARLQRDELRAIRADIEKLSTDSTDTPEAVGRETQQGIEE